MNEFIWTFIQPFIPLTIALDSELVEQLLLAFDGKVIYPENVSREKRFDTVSRSRDENNRFSFSHKGINVGEEISFRYDNTITAKVVGDHEVEYMGYVYKLSPLTRKIMEELGRGNESGAYQGAAYWNYQGQRLAMMKDVVNQAPSCV